MTLVQKYASCGDEQRFSSAAAAIAGALFAKSIDDCLEGLSDAGVKASMALNQAFMSEQTRSRLNQAVQEVNELALSRAAVFIGGLLDGDKEEVAPL